MGIILHFVQNSCRRDRNSGRGFVYFAYVNFYRFVL
nr:MAG TPA: hypothetical protein [Caudoviricetes sp.]